MDDANDKIRAIRESYIIDESGRFDMDAETLSEASESPIESLLAWALVAEFRHNDTLPDTLFWAGALPKDLRYLCGVAVIAQFPFGNGRVDFAVIGKRANRDGDFLIIVECDGHDFHERTKEQARRDRARDRAVQMGGASILRFTGSEIWADASKCARQVGALAHRKRFE